MTHNHMFAYENDQEAPKNYFFYLLKCKDQTVTDSYGGSTTNFAVRCYNHKTICGNEKSNAYNFNVYKFIRSHGGWNNWLSVVVAEKLCTKKEALQYEAEIVSSNNCSLNSISPCAVTNEKTTKNALYLRRKQSEMPQTACKCGGKYKYQHKVTHLKSKKHILFEQTVV